MTTDELKTLLTNVTYLVEDGLDNSDEFKNQLNSELNNYIYKDNGSVNSVILAPIVAENDPQEYTDGMVIYFNPKSNNDGATTVDVNSIGEVPLKNQLGFELPAHFLDVESAYIAIYVADVSEFRCYNVSTLLALVPVIDVIVENVTNSLNGEDDENNDSSNDGSSGNESDDSSSDSSDSNSIVEDEEETKENWEIALDSMNESFPLSDAVSLAAENVSELRTHLNDIPNKDGNNFKIVLAAGEYDLGEGEIELLFADKDSAKRVQMVGAGLEDTTIIFNGDSDKPLIKGEYLNGGLSNLTFKGVTNRPVFELHNSVFDAINDGVKFDTCDSALFLDNSVVRNKDIVMTDVIRGIEGLGSTIKVDTVISLRINETIDYALIAKESSKFIVNELITKDVEVPLLTLSQSSININKTKVLDENSDNDPAYKF